MIKIYGYYSCGGYKDMYLGNSDNCADCTYYLPLLPMIKNRNKAEDADKIEKLEQLSPIHIITNDKHYGFPSECNTLFSHGGYVAIYKTLSNSDTCFALKDIPSTDKDEMGRYIPFNILLIANDSESKSKLENFAFYAKDNYNECIEFCTKLFSYDYIVNGIKFDLPAIIDKIKSLPNYNFKPKYINNHLIYLMIHSVANIEIAFREQKLSRNNTPCVVDTNGRILRNDDIELFSNDNYTEQAILIGNNIRTNESCYLNNTKESYNDDISKLKIELNQLSRMIDNLSDQFDRKIIKHLINIIIVVLERNKLHSDKND